MSNRERRLRLTVYQATRRRPRRGYWSHWKLEIHHENLEERWPTWVEPLTSGWIKRSPSAQFAEFDLGGETDVSRQIIALHYGETS